MNAVTLPVHVKIPRPHGCVRAQKLKLRDGVWEVVADQTANNIVLNQAMNLIMNYYSSASALNLNQQFTLQRAGYFFSSVYASDDATAVSAATIATTGTVLTPQSNAAVTTDAGTIGSREYTKFTREVIFYKSIGLANGYTFRKIYGIYTTNSNYNGRLNRSLATGDPISELLLSSPITITDIETEAVKIIYDLYIPRFGAIANNDWGLEQLGTGVIALQLRDASNNVTVGSNVTWKLMTAPHKTGSISAFAGFNMESIFPNFGILTSASVAKIGVDTDNDPGVESYLPEDTAVRNVTVTNPTATSVKLAATMKLAPSGAVSSSFTAYKLTLFDARSAGQDLNEGSGATYWIEFVEGITLQWTDSLEIQLELTYDWS